MTKRLDQYLRDERRAATLGVDAVCANCGERDRACLHQRGEGVVLCYQCLALADGRSGSEAHHPDGRHNSEFTIPLPANEHRILSEYQRAWPDSTLRNSEGSPLLAAAAALRGFLDTLKLLVDRILGWIPAFLEALDAILREQYGRYWEHATFAPCFTVWGGANRAANPH